MSAIRSVLSGMNLSQSSKVGRNNPWVVGWVLALGTVVLINIAMISLAFITSPGLVDEDYYETGRKYEQNAIKMMEARHALQWQVQMNFPTEITMDTATDINISMVDVNGMPIKEADVSVVSFRPSDADADFTTRMTEIAPGLYSGTFTFSLKGIWDLNVTIARDNDSYNHSQRISVSAL